ncbi:VapD family protein [Anaerolentibacter hominis]|uniref:VapD family protein n=1 Tax=Anaerolentibacter hominis TaxID=3079009 RepID=UPI0031B8044A
MERRFYKALNFDLSTHQLKEHYPGANYRHACDDLRRFFKRNRFTHRQGSGYISDVRMTTADIYDLMDELSLEFPWLGSCVNKIDVTNIGRQHDLTDLLKPMEDITPDCNVLLNGESE